MKTLYLHRVDLGNPGDLHSSPRAFLGPGWQGPTVDMVAKVDLDINVDFVFVGGGDILANQKFTNRLLASLSGIRFRHLVVWGAGHLPDISEPVREQASLWGVREQGPDMDAWVPCVSGTEPEIQGHSSKQALRDFLIVDHWKRRPIYIDADHTRITNNPSTLSSMLQAMADHRYVITSSYHAVYWATLLKRRAVFVSDPWQEKLRDVAWPVPTAQTFSWALLDQTQVYTDALDQVLEANQKFRQRVWDLKDLPAKHVVAADLV